MLSESNPSIRNCLRFLMLPYCFFKLINWKQCRVSKVKVVVDLLILFFRYRTFPDHYSPCRLWEKDESEWAYYYGSSYHPYPRQKLRKKVQPFEHQGLFQNKSQCEEHFKAQGIPMPETYAVISPQEHFGKVIRKIFAGISEDKLILKPLFGSAGRGILLAVKTKDGIMIKGKGTLDAAESFQVSERYLIQQVIVQHESISEIAPYSVNTIRTVPLLTQDDNVIILSASMRFSVGDSFVDNWSAGGLGVGVNYNQGNLMEYAFDKKGNKYTHHPVSNKQFLGFQIPFWDRVCDLTKKAQQASPFYRLIGLDIAVTPRGPIAIEINANPDIIFQEQTGGPLLKDPVTVKEFAKYDLLFNKQQKRLLTK